MTTLLLRTTTPPTPGRGRGSPPWAGPSRRTGSAESSYRPGHPSIRPKFLNEWRSECYRSFGDFLLKSEMDKPPWKQVISPVPQIEQFKIDPSWEFLIIATDGVNTFMSFGFLFLNIFSKYFFLGLGCCDK